MTLVKSAHQIQYNNFIRFHPSANGTDGRPVFIDPDLLPRFLELINLNTAQGEAVARGLIGLKNSAAGTTSDSNTSNAFQHRSIIQNIAVTYTILQQGGRGAGVYITNLQHGFAKDRDGPGLYKVQQNAQTDTPWLATPDKNSVASHGIGVLGAVPPTKEGESGASETARVFATTALSKERKKLSNGFSLFYTPTYVVDNTGVWLTSEQKQLTNSSCPKAFAQLLANAENKSKGIADTERYRWYIVGHGARVFSEALQEYKRLSKYPLNRSHEFYFVDPQVPLSALQQELRNNGIDFYHDNNLLTHTMSTASKLHQLLDPAKTFIETHRSGERFVAVNKSAHETQIALKQRTSNQAYFSDIAKKVANALSGSWG